MTAAGRRTAKLVGLFAGRLEVEKQLARSQLAGEEADVLLRCEESARHVTAAAVRLYLGCLCFTRGDSAITMAAC